MANITFTVRCGKQLVVTFATSTSEREFPNLIHNIYKRNTMAQRDYIKVRYDNYIVTVVTVLWYRTVGRRAPFGRSDVDDDFPSDRSVHEPERTRNRNKNKKSCENIFIYLISTVSYLMPSVNVVHGGRREHEH